METKLAPVTQQRTALWRSDAMQRVLAFGALILMFAGFSLASPYFLQTSNVIGILLATAVNGILALGVTFVIITGGIDLSIGTVMTLSSVAAGVFITMWHLPIALGVVAGLLTGGLAGLVNGVIIARLKVPPFIATLGMLNIAKGLSLVISQLKPIYFDATPGFNTIAMGSVLNLGGIIRGLSIPNAVLILFGAAIVGSVVLSRTVLGRYTFALGSNEEAARLSGVNVDAWKIAVYTVTGLFAGLAGIIIASRVNSAQPSLGQGYELDAIAAAVIGGTSLSGGEGTILGTIIGAFIISTLSNGLRILSVPQEWQIVITGVIVVLAVYLDILRRRGK
ncbi:MAG TPA: ABC transporter permease [Anaerolineae bacterium]